MNLRDFWNRYGPTYASQNPQGSSLLGANNQTGLLSNLGNINPNLLIGANIAGAGFKGQNPFSSVMPSVLQAAKIKQALTPKRRPLKAAWDPNKINKDGSKGGPVYETEDVIIEKNLTPVPQGMVTTLDAGGNLKIMPAHLVATDADQIQKAQELDINNQQLNLLGDRLIQQFQHSPSGAVAWTLGAIESVGDQLKQVSEQVGFAENNVTIADESDPKFFDKYITNKIGIKEGAKSYQRIKANLIRMGYTLARIAEPNNSRFSDRDLSVQLDSIGFGGSRDVAIAGMQEILDTENKKAQIRYETYLPGQKLSFYREKKKRKKGKDPLNPMGLNLD
jgi:hypothetical protein